MTAIITKLPTIVKMFLYLLFLINLLNNNTKKEEIKSGNNGAKRNAIGPKNIILRLKPDLTA